MTSFQFFILAVALPLLSSTAGASNKQTEAVSLIERAKQLSDIRTDGAPAFRLKLEFKASKDDGSVLAGTYTEVWASKTKWRRETIARDFRRTEVAAGEKRFFLEPVKALPEHIGDLPALSDIGRFQPQAWVPEKIQNRELDGASVRCIERMPVVRPGLRSSLCFDKDSGVLTGEIEPSVNPSEDEACSFFDYQKFGERTYPRSYKCLEGEHLRLEGRVVELIVLPQVDPELFAVPNEARELTSCPDPIGSPRVIYQQNPVGGNGSGVVVVLVTIGIDGRPGGLSVASSPSPKLEKPALEALRQWRFRPATCDREPVEAKSAVEIEFQ